MEAVFTLKRVLEIKILSSVYSVRNAISQKTMSEKLLITAKLLFTRQQLSVETQEI